MAFWGLIQPSLGIIVLLMLLQGCSKRSTTLNKQNISQNQTFASPTRNQLREGFEQQVTLLPLQNVAEQKQHTALIKALQEQEARNPDIPIPLEANPYNYYCAQDGKQYALSYTSSNMDYDQLVAWYDLEMERLGWQQIAYIQGTEYMLMYDKPYRFCTILLQPMIRKYGTKAAIKIIVYAGIKKQALN